MWPVVVAVIVIPSAQQNHPALGLNLLFVRPMRESWEGEVEWGMLIAARMALARQLGIFRNYRNPSQGCLCTYRDIP
jgi:hypothetical protein